MMQFMPLYGIFMNVKEKYEEKFEYGGEFESMKLTATGCMQRHKDKSRDEIEDHRSTNWMGMSEVYNERHLLSLAYDLLAKGYKIRKRKGISERLETFVMRNREELEEERDRERLELAKLGL